MLLVTAQRTYKSPVNVISLRAYKQTNTKGLSHVTRDSWRKGAQSASLRNTFGCLQMMITRTEYDVAFTEICFKS